MSEHASRAGEVILEIADLSVDYGTGRSALHALDRVSLDLRRGELLGITGESGSGKSTLAAAATRLLRPPGRVLAGRVVYHPRQGPAVDVLTMDDDALRRWRWEEISVVFQAAMNALNPVAKVSAQLTDVLEVHRPEMDKRARLRRAAELAELVGIHENRLSAYPHQLSGGMRQRVMIAMALALDPEVVVMDEPTTALDVVVQREILTRMSELRAKLGFSVVFITHDLSLLLEMADHIAVMYAGKVVELSPAEDIYRAPLHPYTEGLLGSFPSLIGPRRELVGLMGSPPDLRRVPPGCAYHERCPLAAAVCAQEVPGLVSAEGRSVACHFRSPSTRAAPPGPDDPGDVGLGLLEAHDG